MVEKGKAKQLAGQDIDTFDLDWLQFKPVTSFKYMGELNRFSNNKQNRYFISMLICNICYLNTCFKKGIFLGGGRVVLYPLS